MALQDAIGFVEAQLARFAEVVCGFGGVTGIEATKAPVVVGFGKTGILADGLGEIVDSTAVVFAESIESGTVVKQVGIVGTPLQGFVEIV